MKRRRRKPRIWTLRGSTGAALETKLAVLTTMFETTKEKGMEVAQLRQKNLNYALIIFAGISTFSFTVVKGEWYSVCCCAALLVIMFCFAKLDRKFHRYIHGWRETEKFFTTKMVQLINNPKQDIKFIRYIAKGEKKAEAKGHQPLITYSLVIGALAQLLYSGYLWIKPHL